MPYLVKADFNTHIYAELIADITRADDAVINTAIEEGIDEVKAYLNRYDLLKLFGDADTAPEVTAPHLKKLTKDVVSWHLVKLANPNIDLKLFRTIYEDAITFLKLIQKGQADPDGWPYKTDNPDTPEDESSTVQWSSNKKRTQHF